MKITTWKHENVNEDGVILSLDGKPNGAVHTEPNVELLGLLVIVNKGRDSKTSTVSGLTIQFDNYEEIDQWYNTLDILNDIKPY
jgi:hypothetical protein